MTVLLFVEDVGPTEALLVEAVRASGQRPVVFDVTRLSFVGQTDLEAPIWLSGDYFGTRHPAAQAYFHRVAAELEVGHSVSVGLRAAAFASDVVDAGTHLPVLLRGDLNFSASRSTLVGLFQGVVRRVSGLVLEDKWEMDKAVGHGSLVPHFLLPLARLGSQSILDGLSAAAAVGVIRPDVPLTPRESARIERMRADLAQHGIPVRVLHESTLFTLDDLLQGENLASVLARRLSGLTHIVLTGDGRHTRAVYSALMPNKDRVFVEDTYNSHYMYSPHANAARGSALLARVVQAAVGTGHEDPPMVAHGSGAQAQSRDPAVDLHSFLGHLSGTFSRSVPWCYEEDPSLDSSDHFDVFFSVAPIENRTNGARPQRIRNASQAFESGTHVVRFSPHINLLRRRRAWIDYLVSQGHRPRFFYGENSTSPIPGYDAITALGELLRQIRALGARSGWFIRDLHWLSPDAAHLHGDTRRSREMTERGAFELNTVLEGVDLVFAPCESAIGHFKELASRIAPPDLADWRPLPPGVAEENVVDFSVLAGRGMDPQAMTVAYSGGVGGLYRLDRYLAALSELGEGFYFDFVVRAEDVAPLEAELRRYGLSEDQRVRVITEDFEDYTPRTGFAVASVLLDTTYAQMTFPYKVMSAFERHMPILTYRGTDVGDLVERTGAGMCCEMSVQSIRDTLVAMRHAGPSRLAITGEVLSDNSWRGRVDHVREALRTARTP